MIDDPLTDEELDAIAEAAERDLDGDRTRCPKVMTNVDFVKWYIESRRKSDVPFRLEDPAVCETVAAMMGPPQGSA